mmetsp:Transcript_10021/g.23038  ORF Transcript_10021/g.23038 Transcript_10021/m.23038 type:complete len:203 (-) Transcript_10021:490-1098(-)
MGEAAVRVARGPGHRSAQVAQVPLSVPLDNQRIMGRHCGLAPHRRRQRRKQHSKAAPGRGPVPLVEQAARHLHGEWRHLCAAIAPRRRKRGPLRSRLWSAPAVLGFPWPRRRPWPGPSATGGWPPSPRALALRLAAAPRSGPSPLSLWIRVLGQTCARQIFRPSWGKSRRLPAGTFLGKVQPWRRQRQCRHPAWHRRAPCGL